VLSVNKALSIQSHPDKALAERLHAEHPKVRALGARLPALCAPPIVHTCWSVHEHAATHLCCLPRA
jgi:hypothetical protein